MRPNPAVSCRVVLLALPLLLSGCGIPGAIAHGVKSVENSQSATSPSEPSQSARKSRRNTPPPAIAAPEPAVVSTQLLAPPPSGP